MSSSDPVGAFNRRDFMSSAAVMGGAALAASVLGPSDCVGRRDA